MDIFSATPFIIASLGLVLIAYLRRRKSSNRKEPPLPPGPKPHWLVGHTFQVPQKKAWLYFEKLGREYGPIVSLNLAGDNIVILNDPKDAEELLGKRSHNYSSRKPLIYAGKYLSDNKRMVLAPYGPMLKKQRLAFHQMLQPRVIGSYESMQLSESARFLHNMLHKPSEAFLHAKRFSAALVFRLAYGRHLDRGDNDLREVLQILDDFIEDCYPGTHLVDTFPVLDSWWIPDWVARWRGEARWKHEREVKFYTRLLEEVKARMDAGEPTLECFSARLWDQKEQMKFDIESMAYSSAFEAGTGTTSGMIHFFLMAMILYPSTLKKAQDEIDRVLRSDELNPAEHPPTFEHIDRLPYCVALCKEVFRWIPAAPGGFPHYSDAEDTYRGYRIPANTMVIPNIWAMQHDERFFANPLVFDPERFLRKAGGSPAGVGSKVEEHDPLTEGHWAFGFGRRACPGKYMGAKSVWIGITQLMWAFDISHALDEAGQPIPIDTGKVTSGINIEPEEFAMSVTPRSEVHRRTIERLWIESENEIGSS